MPNVGAAAMTTRQPPQQVSLFALRWKPKAGQPLPWEIKQKLCKPKGGRNKKGALDNFHNRDYDFVSPEGEIFTGKGVRQFAALHGLSESALLDVLNGRVHSCKGWTKAVGGRKLPVPPTYYFLSPTGVIHTTTNLSEFARQHSLDPIALSRISRCIKGTHRGWRHCTPDGQPILPPNCKHRKFILRSPNGEIVEGSNLKAFAEQHGLSRTCLMNVLGGTTKEHRGWTLPLPDVMTTTAPNLGKVFNGTARPATPEDIAILTRGDWVKVKDDPWCWKFKRWNDDAAIVEWEGDEFVIPPTHQLMVVEILEGQACEKFFRKPEQRNLKETEISTDCSQIKVGDRLIAPNNAIGIVRSVTSKKITIDWGKSGTKVLIDEYTPKEIQDYGYKPVLDPEEFSMSENDGSGEPPEPDDFKSIKEFEEAWEKWENSLQDTSSQEEAGIQKVQLPQDTNLSGQLKTTPTPRPSTENGSPIPDSLSKISVPSQMSLFSDSQYQMSQFGVRLVQIFPWLVSEMGLLEFADNCFLKDSDFFGSDVHPHLCLRTLTDSLAQTKGLPSRKSSKRLQVWGIAAPGNLGMETATSPKTENGFSSWAITADIRATQPNPKKKTLQEVFNCNGVNSASGEKIDEAYTLKASTPKLGAGNKSHPNTFVSIPVKVYVDGVAEAQESPALCAGGWQHRSPLHRDKRGASFAVLYRAASGDRLYHDQAPTLRSLANKDNHQAGSGAYKIREYNGETYLERPINATEAEQLMGWEVGSTAIGINREGDEISISQTQRIKMLGNGIIPAEITDILTAIKPMLLRKLESEIPSGYDFAYKQLRQRGMSHQEALKHLGSS
jgi:hypothetical protein